MISLNFGLLALRPQTIIFFQILQYFLCLDVPILGTLCLLLLENT